MTGLFSSAQRDTAYYEVGLANAGSKTFDLTFRLKVNGPVTDLKLPVWTPGYYQLMDYARHLKNFQVTDENGQTLPWQKSGAAIWRIGTEAVKEVSVRYQIQTERAFIANPYIDQNRAFLRPTGLFLYTDEQLHVPVVVDIRLANGWNRIATGLDSIAPQRYFAADFNVLFDSPILVGILEELPVFSVAGKPHRFIGYDLQVADGAGFMKDVEKIVKTASNIIGDIPYKHYTFIGIGPGNGGIEQLNSTAISFSGKELTDASSRTRMLSFIAHEYFHHYNIKRIRPIELGPFDYSRANRTNGLWVGEGLTVYYESQILNRAGLISGVDVLETWRRSIESYENNPGRKKQSLARSSSETWEDGPFGRKGETISFYEKGPLLGILLDITIRVNTNNRKSLDDVMRELYYSYNIKLQRGFTEAEIKMVCERIAGRQLDEIFSYIYTTDDIDYKKYLDQAGIRFNLTWEQSGKAVATLQRQATSDLHKNIQKALMN